MKPARLLVPGLLGLIMLLAVACPAPEDPTPTPTLPVATPTPEVTPTPDVSPDVTPDNDAAQGQQVFTAMGCGACHTIEGVPGALGMIGPELTHIGTVAETRDPPLSAEEYIRRSIESPGEFVVEGFPPGVMPELRGQMSDEEFEALVAFLLAQE